MINTMWRVLLFVVWFRSHMIFTFCHTVVPVFRMVKATDSTSVMSHHFKTFPEKRVQRYGKEIERRNDLVLYSIGHFFGTTDQI